MNKICLFNIKRKQNDRKNHGFALVEVILAIVIMSIITIAAIKGYQRLMLTNSQQKVEQTMNQSIVVVQNLRANMVDYVGTTTGVQAMVTAANLELAKTFNYLPSSSIPTISAASTTANLGIVQATISLSPYVCNGVSSYYLFNTSQSFKGASLVASSGGTPIATGIINYNGVITNDPTSGNYVAPILNNTGNVTTANIQTACVNGANLSVYF
jgi:prepilin-type N-terminal cleavage/methylation domain-containing protein